MKHASSKLELFKIHGTTPLSVRILTTVKARLLRLSHHHTHRGRDLTALVRMAIDDFLQHEEDELKLNEMTERERLQMSAIFHPHKGDKKGSNHYSIIHRKEA